jgi:hypothetical protein
MELLCSHLQSKSLALLDCSHRAYTLQTSLKAVGMKKTRTYALVRRDVQVTVSVCLLQILVLKYCSWRMMMVETWSGPFGTVSKKYSQSSRFKRNGSFEGIEMITPLWVYYTRGRHLLVQQYENLLAIAVFSFLLQRRSSLTALVTVHLVYCRSLQYEHGG